MLAANGGVWRVKVDGFGSFSGAERFNILEEYYLF
jgi:hypothetical protein